MSMIPAVTTTYSTTNATVAAPISNDVRYSNLVKSNTTEIGKLGCDPFPMLDKAWDIFAGKGIRTVFLSIGTSASPLADLEISESLGCPLHIVPLNATEKGYWGEVSAVLKARTRDASSSKFTELVDTKWILPKNIRMVESVPWWENGTIDISGTEAPMPTQKVDTLITSLCGAMKLKDSAKRLDILKVDTNAVPGLELSILGSIMSSGFRPSVILVKWSKMPDEDVPTMIAAGNLQCCGYSLFTAIDNKFLYYYNDDNLYEICSWETPSDINPIAKEILKASSRNF